jgi:hypothetical protein
MQTTLSARNYFFTTATATSLQGNSTRNLPYQNNNPNSTRGSSISSSGHDNDSSHNNDHNWHPLLYINPWERQQQQQTIHASSTFTKDSHCYLQPLDAAPAADVATRHLIQLLQDVYHYGHARVVLSTSGSGSSGSEHVSLSRCHQVLQNLVALPVHIPGRAQRADAILVLLQLIDEKQQRASHRARDGKATTATTAVGKKQKNQDHRSAFAPLAPSHETYKIVLQLYATTTTTTSASSSNATATHDDEDDSMMMTIPLRAQELLQQMQDQYQRHRNLQLKPHAYHINRVLYCWKECQHDLNRVLYATRFFLKHVVHEPGNLDATSFVLIMRICSSNLHHQPASSAAAILGAKAAIRVWQVALEQQHQSPRQSLDLPSHFYAHFLQAIRALSDQTTVVTGDSSSKGSSKSNNSNNDFELRKQYFAKCFIHARDHGKLNAHVLQEFLVHVRSKRLTQQLLGHDLMQVIHGVSPATRAVEVLQQNMPSSWKERATNKNIVD